MILPNYNISIMDIHNTLGDNSLDLGTLCISDKINMWAKYKPVRSSITYHYPETWWKSEYGNCGINYNTYTSLSTMITDINNGVSYSYDQPRGGAAEPYRLGDFRGYDTNAQPPIQAAPMQETYYKTHNYVDVSAFITLPMEGWLNVEDVFGSRLYSNIYFGCGINLKGSPGQIQWMTESTPITPDGGDSIIEFPTTSINLGNNECYFFLTDTVRPNPIAEGQAANYIPLFNGKAEFNLEQTGVLIYINAEYLNGTISGEVIFNNQLAYTVNLTGCTLTLRYASSQQYDEMKNGEGTIQIANTTVTAGSTVRIPFSTSTLLPDMLTEGGGYVTFRSNGGQYSAISMIGEPF